jgi:leader peptidase (prepilin peptidase)/N-methyltransferase
VDLSVFLGVAFFAFGLVFGSFANVVIWRLPRGESLSSPGSHCPKCETPIAWRDNIPLLSWVLLRGRCRSCGEPISFRYPVVELLSGALWLLAYFAFGFTLRGVIAVVFFYVLLILSAIDIDTMRLPNDLVWLLFVVGIFGLLLSVFAGVQAVPLISPEGGFLPAIWALLGVVLAVGFALLVSLVYRLARKKEGLGMGDIKLLAVLGLFLGPNALLALFLASAVGAVVGVVSTIRSRGEMTARVPFGPYLAGAAVFVSVWGPRLLGWYLGL